MVWIIYIIGGVLAGFVTGLVGLSAAVIIAPLFATMLGMDPYMAIGIALATDIFASAVSSVNDIFDAAEEAIREILARDLRCQDEYDLPPEVEQFYRLHNEIVHGDDPEVDMPF